MLILMFVCFSGGQFYRLNSVTSGSSMYIIWHQLSYHNYMGKCKTQM